MGPCQWPGVSAKTGPPVRLSSWIALPTVKGMNVLRPFLSREVGTFLAVGGTGYVVDVVAFNVLRSIEPFAGWDPAVARTVAVAIAMVVTYIGNRTLTWRDVPAGDRRREVALFVLFNIIGFGFSVVALVVSHDLLGLTSRLADNVSANVMGWPWARCSVRHLSAVRVRGGAAQRPGRAAARAGLCLTPESTSGGPTLVQV